MQRRIQDHQRSFHSTLARFSASKWATTMTILALGIGLAIPALLYSLTDTFGSWVNHWDGRPQVSLYLKQGTDETAAQVTRKQAEHLALVDSTEFITAEQALKDFRQITQFDAALDSLNVNPLPAVIIAYLNQHPSAHEIRQLQSRLRALPQVESVQYDLEWLQRLSAINRVLNRSVTLLATLLTIGVLLLIANTIRLEINTRHTEITITDQLGATKAFVRRPFLYFGAMEGFLGGLAGLLITLVGRQLLSEPLTSVTPFYTEITATNGLSLGLVIVLLAGGAALGWIAARVTVWRHLQLLKPE